MPELPEVQTIVNDLNNSGITGIEIKKVHVNWRGCLAGDNPVLFEKKLKSEVISSISRRGKYVVMLLQSGKYLIIHLRMTGKLLTETEYHRPSKHEHVYFAFMNGKYLYYHDIRKFGRLYLVNDSQTVLGQLGVEPLGNEFTSDWLRVNLRKKNRQIKPLLLDQSFIAGLGNIYVDEALWEAGIHPLTRSNEIPDSKIPGLHSAIILVLEKGLKNLGTSLGNTDLNFLSTSGRRGRNQDMLNVFRRDGFPCNRCGVEIQRIVIGQRGTHFCPACQKL